MDSYLKKIGVLPEKWRVARLKDIAELYTGNSIKDDDKEKYTDEDGAIPYIATKDINVDNQCIDYSDSLFVKNEEKSFKRAKKGSTLLCIEGGSAGKKIAFTDKDVCFVNKLCCFYSSTDNNKFIYYYLMSPAFSEMFNSYIAGLIGGVSIASLKNFYICLPGKVEQKQIADFLDEKCAEIDKLSEDIQEQIEILEEYKKSVITRAVTKGLDSNVEMKESGEDRFGVVPKQWMLKKIKYLAKEISEGGMMNPESDKYLGLENVPSYSNEYLPTDTEYGVSFQKKCKKGNIMFGKLRPYLVKVIICPFDGFSTGEFMQLANYDGDIRFLRYAMLEDSFIELVNMSTYGAKMPRANSEFILNLKICVPQRDEQKVIADYLDSKCNEIDMSIETKNQQLTKLAEYKKSIIYEYVTGKKRVA